MMRITMLHLIAAAALPFATVYAADDKPIKPVIAVYDLEGVISESGKTDASALDLTMDPARPLTMLDIVRSLQKAANDPAVKAVVIDADGTHLDFSQIQEVRRELMAIRKSGKDVWIYTEHLSNGTAVLGSAANHFTLMPEADCSFHGISAESMYFKDLLDKLGIQADVIHIGDFKSYGETFYRTGPSDQAKQQQEALIDSIFNQIVALVAEGRKLDTAKVRAIIDDGAADSTDMLKAGIADHRMFRTDFVRALHDTYGKDAKFNRQYELPDLDGPEIQGLMDVFKLAFSSTKATRHTNDFVAVVALDGDITEESISPIRTQILKLAKDTKAKALVLRVNSPGGSAMASEILWEATDEWKATGKPFVVSMGGVAASGGYYVSSAADRIFAQSGTITGSIGVVGMKIVLGGAMQKLGITSHTTERGKNAGTNSMTRGFSKEEAETVRKSMLKTYATFKKRVTDGRGKALKGDLEPLAGGRVYSGNQALEIGLVDEIGGLNEAVAYVAKAAKLESPEVKLLPEPKSGLEGLFAKPEKKKDDEIIHASTSNNPSQLVRAFIITNSITNALPKSARSALNKLATRIEAYQKTQILLIAPDLELR